MLQHNILIFQQATFIVLGFAQCSICNVSPACAAAQEPARLQCVLQAAVDLSTSTKPFDSITAAYLLNLLLHQEALQQALLHCAHEKSVPLHITDFTQAPEVSILEKNTLAGILKSFCLSFIQQNLNVDMCLVF